MKLIIRNGQAQWILTEEEKQAVEKYGTSRSIGYFKKSFGDLEKLFSMNGYTLYFFHNRINDSSDYLLIEDSHLEFILANDLERVSTIEFCLKNHTLEFIHWLSDSTKVPEIASIIIKEFQKTFQTTPIEIKPAVYQKMYIAVLDTVPDHMVPVLVAHSVLSAHLEFEAVTTPLVTGGSTKVYDMVYKDWLKESFRKCVVKVNQKEFDRIATTLSVHLGHENTTLDGIKSCAVVKPVYSDAIPNVLKFAKLWSPSND